MYIYIYIYIYVYVYCVCVYIIIYVCMYMHVHIIAKMMSLFTHKETLLYWQGEENMPMVNCLTIGGRQR